MKVWRTTSLTAAAFVALLAAPAAAAATMAPTYMSSEPEDGQMLERAPERVEVTFDEPLDESSDLSVKDECGRSVDDGDVQVEANTMTVGLALKPVGTYQVTYFARGIGGVTGQETGTFDFMVHKGPSCGPEADGHGGHDDGKHGDGKHGDGKHRDGRSGKHDRHGGRRRNHDGRHEGSGGGHSYSGNHGGGTDHSSMNHGGRGGNHSSSAGGSRHSSARHGDRHGGDKHGKSGGKHGGKHGAAGAHGLLDILEKNEREAQPPLAAGDDVAPGAPDGQAVLLALGLSLVMGVLGGWFLRVSGQQ